MQDVTGEPVDPQWNVPLWTDERIINEITNHPKGFAAAVTMRNEYERDRANFQALWEQYISKPDTDDLDSARLVAQVEALQAELARLKEVVAYSRHDQDAARELAELMGDDDWDDDEDEEAAGNE